MGLYTRERAKTEAVVATLSLEVLDDLFSKTHETLG